MYFIVKKNICKIVLILLLFGIGFHYTTVYADQKTQSHVRDGSGGGGGNTSKSGSSGSYVEEDFTCENPQVYRAMGMVGKMLLLARILIPIIIVIMASINFGKSVISQDDTDVKELFFNLLKKVIIGAVIFFIPAIVLAIADGVLSSRSTSVKWDLCIEALQKGKLERG